MEREHADLPSPLARNEPRGLYPGLLFDLKANRRTALPETAKDQSRIGPAEIKHSHPYKAGMVVPAE